MSRREPGEGPTNAAPASGRAARAGRHAPKPSPAAAPGQPLRAGGYTDEHASAGLQAELPAIDTFANQFPGYRIVIEHPEFTSSSTCSPTATSASSRRTPPTASCATSSPPASPSGARCGACSRPAAA